MATKLSPKMQELVNDLRAGTIAVYAGGGVNKLQRFRINGEGQAVWSGQLSPTAWALVERGVLVPHATEVSRYVLA